MRAIQEAVKFIVQTHIMLSRLSNQDKRFIESLFVMKKFATDAVIVEQDQPMEGMMVVYSGRVRLKQTRRGKRISLGVLEKETSFGEESLLEDDTWPYQISAVEETIVFELPSRSLRQAFVGNPEMVELFKEEIGYISLSHSLRGILGDTAYSPQVFSDILHAIGVKRIKGGGTVFAQDSHDPRLYCIESGEVRLSRTSLQGENLVLDQVKYGGLIGEEAALEDLGNEGTHRYAAQAVTDTTVLVIGQQQVKEILAINPALYEQLRLRAVNLREREHEESNVRRRSEGVDQRIRLASGLTEAEFVKIASGEKVHKDQIARFALVKQRNENDCAAACLTMIVNHYGKKFQLGQVAELGNLSATVATPTAILTAAEKMGFSAAPFALRMEELDKVRLPGIIGWENHHFAVLYRISKKHIYLADPAKGLMKLEHDEFFQGWSQAQVVGVETDEGAGVFIGLNPTVNFEALEPPKNAIMHFVRYLLPHKKFFMDALVAAMILNLLGLASPLFIQTIVDTVVVHKDVSLLNIMLGGMVLVAIFKTLTTVAQSMLLAHTTARIDMRMMSEFYRHVLSLPMSFFLTRNKGEILTRFGENQKIRAIIAGSTITIVLSLLMMFVYFLLMASYSGVLTLVACIFIPMYIGITLYFTPKIKEIAQQMFLTNSQSQSYLIESLNGIETIKATANEYMARSRWEEAFVDNVNMGFEMQKLNLISNSLSQLVQLASTVAILWVGATLVMSEAMTIGELMGFQMLLGLVMGPVFQVVQLWNSSQDVRIAIDRVTDILSVESEQEPVTSPEKMPSLMGETVQGRIVFDKVNFSYTMNGSENAIMREFELTIEPGQHVAFVGTAGCGKSTIAKMVLGFNMPHDSGGGCLIDGKDIRHLDLQELRNNIGVVLQDGFLFGATVAENIALGDPEPNLVQVRECARLAGAEEFIQHLALGYQTRIGEKGVGLSGGQRQRVCIARALYRRPKIMLFDEATSALDNETEALVQKNIDRILTGRTSITIAHRLTTIINSDLICFIRGGKVAEKGTHQELIDPEYLRKHGYEGLYYQLAAKQFGLPELDLS